MEQPKYSFINPPPEDRCGAIRFNCCNEECDYRFPEEDRVTPICPECNTHRKICGSYPSKGRTRCKFDGGAVPRGLANVNYKGRGVSKHLPSRLLEHYLLAYNDPDIVEMNDSIALLYARSIDLRNQVDDYASSELWETLAKTWQKWVNANRLANTAKSRPAQERAQALFFELEDIVMRGLKQSQNWKELYDVEERLRKTRNSEINRRTKAEEIISPSQFRSMLGFIINSIKTRVSNPDEQMAVLGDLESLNL